MKTPEQLAEEYAESWYPNPSNRDFQTHDIKNLHGLTSEHWLNGYLAGFNKAMEWVPVGERLPEEKNKWHESDYVLGKESETSYPFTVWYNHESNIWHLADHRITIQQLNVAFWMPILNHQKHNNEQD